MEEIEFNPLRQETVIARYIPKDTNYLPKGHLIEGGMIEGATKTYTVPLIASTGTLKNVLTNAEKTYFEKLLGVDLGIYNKTDNYWINYKVRLNKGDNYFDMSNPDDYIKVKVLLTNTNFICPSLEVLHTRPLATYQFVLVTEGQELNLAADKRQMKKECYKLAGKIENDHDVLVAVIEMLDKRPVADKTSDKFLANKLDEFIDSDTKSVYKILNDENLYTTVFIKKCVKAGLIFRTGDFYYMKSGKSKVPMCEEGKDPDLRQAVRFINMPKNQEIKFALEAQLKNPEKIETEE